MTVQEIEKALEEAFDSLEKADSELLAEILESDRFTESYEMGAAQDSVEQILYAVRRFIEEKNEKAQAPATGA